jgi:hypothetical protein
MLNMNTCIPAQVESFDSLAGTVTAKPSIKRKYVKDEEVVEMPPVYNVPVVFPRANDAVITFPIKKGDTVLLVFSQRSLERWKLQGGTVEAGDPRHHDLSDAIAIPGIYPKVKPILGYDSDNLVVRHGLTSKITVKKDKVEIAVGAGKLSVDKAGKFEIGNGVIDLLAVLDEILTAIQALTVPTGVGPSGPPINLPSFAVAQTKLGTIKA